MARWNLRARSVQAGLLVAAMLAAAAPAAAEVRVIDAGGGELVIEAHDATVQQILAALGESRTIRFQSTDALSRQVTGTYRGTLRRVLSRILDGYDHVIRSTSSGIQIDIVAAAQSSKAAASAGTAMTLAAAPAAPRAAPRSSSNVDADEEVLQPKAVSGPQTVNMPSAPHASGSAMQPARAALLGNALHPRVSSNLDADEVTTQ